MPSRRRSRPQPCRSADAAADDDLSALAWVHDELRRSLEAAHKALRRYLKEAEAAAAPTSTPSTPRCCAARARSCTRAWARSSWSACRRRRPRAARQRSRGAAHGGASPRWSSRRPSRRSNALRSRCSTSSPASSPASRSRRWRCSRNTAPRSSWPAPTASIRPTCGRSTGHGCDLPPDAIGAAAPCRRRRARRDGVAGAGADARARPHRAGSA